MAGYSITTTTSTPWRDIKNTAKGKEYLQKYGSASAAYNAYNADQKKASIDQATSQQKAAQKEQTSKASMGASASRAAAEDIGMGFILNL